MRALVTGGAGFIGSNLVDALVARGDAVDVLDDLSTGRRENLDGALEAGALLHVLDVRDGPALRELAERTRPEVVFHLAAQIDVRRSVAEPALDGEVNVLGTVNVLEAARAAGAARVVHSSTGGAIYGEAGVVPTPEDAPARPISPYGQSKLAAEGYAALYGRLHGLPVVALRYANVYGARQDPLGEGGVVAIFCGRARAGEQATIFGDGEQTRDFVHVDDVVAANLAAAGGGEPGAWNVGRGEETSLLDLAAALRSLGFGAFAGDHAPARAGEVRRSALDAGRAASALGWEPRVGLEEGLRRTLASL